jgi:hypothetical protein
MSYDNDEETELSKKEKQEVFQDLLSGTECALLFIAISLVHLFLLRSGPLQPYIAKARWICPSIHPFLDVSRVFYAGLPEVPQNEEGDIDDIV